MSGIINRAKQLLDGATPAPWELSETEVTHRLLGGEAYEFGGEPVLVVGGKAEEVDSIEHEDTEDEPPYFYLIQHYADCELMAAAPELAQALSEETWEYQVEEKWLTNSGAEWRPVEKVWHSSIRDARLSSPAESQTRIVRRRVSPPEVINE